MSDKIEELQKELQLALNEKRSTNALIEKAQISLLIKHIEKERKRFDYAETSQFLLQDKNDSDLILLMDKISEWGKLAKEENKKIFNDLFLAVLRVQSYTQNLETLNKHSVAKYIGEVELVKNTASNSYSEKLKFENQINILKKEIDVLKKEIDVLKKEIEFITKNG